MSKIPPQKIGFYFENSLPSAVSNGDDFSFIYVKESNQKFPNWNKTVLYLAIPKPDDTSDEFIRLSDTYVHSVNNVEVSDDNNVNVGLGDIVSFNGNIPKEYHLSLDNKIHFGINKSGDSLFIGTGNINNYKDRTTYSNSVIINSKPNTVSNTDIPLDLSNSFLVGNFGNFGGKIRNSIMIDSSDTVLLDKYFKTNLIWENNFFLGGIKVSDNEQTNIESNSTNEFIIKDNIFINNLGFGKTTDYFQLIPKLKLPENTEIITEETEIGNILVTDNTNKVKSISKSTLKHIVGSSDSDYQIIQHTNSVSKDNFAIVSNSKSILPNIRGTFGSYFINYQPNTTYENSFVFGQNNKSTNVSNVYGYGNHESNNSLIYGNNNGINYGNPNINKIESSIIFGNRNLSRYNTNSKNYIFGNENLSLQGTYVLNTITFLGRNKIFGDGNLSAIGNLNNGQTSPEVVDNIIFGDNNLKCGGNNNIIFGDNNIKINNTVANNTIIFGNSSGKYSPYSYDNFIAFGNNWDNVTDTNISKYSSNNTNLTYKNVILFGNDSTNLRPLFVINPDVKKLWLEGKVYFNTDFLLNSEMDMTHNKILTIGGAGDIGYVPDNFIKKTSSVNQNLDINNSKLKLTNLTNDINNTIYKWKLALSDTGDIVKQPNNDLTINFDDNIIIRQDINFPQPVSTLVTNNIFFEDTYRIVMQTLKGDTQFKYLTEDDWQFNVLNEPHPQAQCQFSVQNNLVNMNCGNGTAVTTLWPESQERVVCSMISKKKFDTTKNWVIHIKANFQLVVGTDILCWFGLCSVEDENLSTTLKPNYVTAYIKSNTSSNFRTKTNMVINPVNGRVYVNGFHPISTNITISCINGVILFTYVDEINQQLKEIDITENIPDRYLRIGWTFGSFSRIFYGKQQVEGYFKYYEFPEDFNFISQNQIEYENKLNQFISEANGNLTPMNPDKIKLTKNSENVTQYVRIHGNDILYSNTGIPSTQIKPNNLALSIGAYYDEIFPADKDWFISFGLSSFTNAFEQIFGFTTDTEESSVNKFPNIYIWHNKGTAGFFSNLSNIPIGLDANINNINGMPITINIIKIGDIIRFEYVIQNNQKTFYINIKNKVDLQFCYNFAAININASLVASLQYYIKP